MQISSIPYQNLFKFRSVWMGIAILWIMLYHSDINLDFLSTWKSFGYGGVDIFFFASGLGCYYSLQKQPDPAAFLAKRMKRILPPYYIALAIWFALEIFLVKTNFTGLEILSNIFCTGTFSVASNQFNWYVSGVWPSYLLAPFLVSFVDRSRPLHRLLLLFVLFLASTTFLSSYWNLMLFSTRLPIFYIGILFAKAAQEKHSIKFRTCFIWILIMLAGVTLLLFCNTYAHSTLTDWGLWWYPFILIIPGLCLSVSLLCLGVERIFRLPATILATIGNCSFELYLIHLTIYSVIFYLKENAIYLPNNTFWLFTIPACCVLAVFFHKGMTFWASCFVNSRKA